MAIAARGHSRHLKYEGLWRSGARAGRVRRRLRGRGRSL